jgi:Mannosylglycerate hydrolase MGH1-like glycoside hydrolase domain
MLKWAPLAVLLMSSFGTAVAQPSERDGSTQSLESLIGKSNYALLRGRLETLNKDIAERGLHDFPGAGGKLITGYAYGEYYDWDLYFENVYLSYYGVSKYNFTNLKVFLDRQQQDGFVSRTLGITYARPTQMFKPFLAQIAVLGSKQNGDDYGWLRDRYYQRLQKYLERWFAYDKDGNGLPVWNSSDASGMDNQISRSGDLESYTDEGVDLACYLYRELQAMEIIAGKLGKTEDQSIYAAHASRLAKTINKVFWDEKDGFYYDRNEKTGQPIKIKSVAGLIPLWAGIASQDQARRLVKEHLLNEREFWLTYPVATYARTQPEFYEGSKHGECNWQGTTWIPTNYMIFHGLMRYGYKDVAQQLALKSLRLALVENPATREYYDSDTGRGNGMNPFWGWSSLAYVMPLDFVGDYDPTDLNAPIKALVTSDIGISFDGAAN